MAGIKGNIGQQSASMRFLGGWLLFFGMSLQIVYNVAFRPDLPIRALVFVTAFLSLLMIMQGFFRT